MKLFSLLILLPFIGFSQNNTECDSVVIACCTFDSQNTDTLTLSVTNNSSYLFPYPGFILFNSTMDTVARENVNYFGIGNSPQQHHLEILIPINLPFVGSLRLYSGFYDSLHCTFPITIPDSITGLHILRSPLNVSVFPNPANDRVNVSLDHLQVGDQYTLQVVDLFGKCISASEMYTSTLSLNLEKFPVGIYILNLVDATKVVLGRSKLFVRR